MREKYETLNLVDLKEIAKKRGLKGVSTLKKVVLIDRLCDLDSKETAAPIKKEPAKKTSRSTTVRKTSEKTAPVKKTSEAAEKSPAASADTASENAVTGTENISTPSAPKRKYSSEEKHVSKIGSLPITTRRSAPTTDKRREDMPRQREDSGRTGRDLSKAPGMMKAARDTSASSREYSRYSNDNRKPSHRVVMNGNKPAGRPPYNRDAHKPNTPYNAHKENEVRENQPVRKYPEPVRNENETPSVPAPAPAFTPAPVVNDNLTPVGGIIEIMNDGFGFIRSENYLSGDNDIYIAPTMIRKFGLRTGDILQGASSQKNDKDKFAALTRLDSINGYTPEESMRRLDFRKMTPIFPNERLTLENGGSTVAMRIMDLIDPIGKGQRGMIVSPPKAGKTTLLKEVAKSIKANHPNMHIIILLIDERPEEVTDMKESIEGPNVEVIHSTFDELPEHHTKVAEMTIEHARRLVEHKQDVMILIDSITRLTRAYNQVVPPSGRTLSGGLDPAALHMPKRFFGAARNMREGGSLTILATALIETGSKMDDVVYEEFKGTGNMELILDRKLQEKRIFPAINIAKSSTRREDLLLTPEELNAVNRMRKGFNGMKADDVVDQILNMFAHTRNNRDFIRLIEKQMF